eukprot:scaffold44018_cov70-Phaeocystis_antarctica.AAC.2
MVGAAAAVAGAVAVAGVAAVAAVEGGAGARSMMAAVREILTVVAEAGATRRRKRGVATHVAAGGAAGAAGARNDGGRLDTSNDAAGPTPRARGAAAGGLTVGKGSAAALAAALALAAAAAALAAAAAAESGSLSAVGAQRPSVTSRGTTAWRRAGRPSAKRTTRTASEKCSSILFSGVRGGSPKAEGGGTSCGQGKWLARLGTPAHAWLGLGPRLGFELAQHLRKLAAERVDG